jgi:hypothetical protein
MTKLEAIRDELAESFLAHFEEQAFFKAGFDACLNTVVKDLAEVLAFYGKRDWRVDGIYPCKDNAIDVLKKWDLSK